MQKNTKEAQIMNVNGITGKIKKNAFLVSAAVSAYSRGAEYDPNNAIGMAIDLLTKVEPNGGPLYELQKSFSSTNDLKYKLWDAPHAAQSIIKIGTAIRLASEFGYMKSYKKASEDMIKGAALIALLTPGSSPPGGSAFRRNGNVSVGRASYQY